MQNTYTYIYIYIYIYIYEPRPQDTGPPPWYGPSVSSPKAWISLRNMVSDGFLWFPMVSYRFLWIPMDFYGFLWCGGGMGFLWIPMVSYGFLWIPMISYGFLWIPVISSCSKTIWKHIENITKTLENHIKPTTPHHRGGETYPKIHRGEGGNPRLSFFSSEKWEP